MPEKWYHYEDAPDTEAYGNQHGATKQPGISRGLSRWVVIGWAIIAFGIVAYVLVNR
jgi:hypothetical protein